MLVLSRKKNETLVIGDGLIKITIVDIRGDKVRIAISAPSDITVDREEIYEKKQKAQSQLAQSKGTCVPTIDGSQVRR